MRRQRTWHRPTVSGDPTVTVTHAICSHGLRARRPGATDQGPSHAWVAGEVQVCLGASMSERDFLGKRLQVTAVSRPPQPSPRLCWHSAPSRAPA